MMNKAKRIILNIMLTIVILALLGFTIGIENVNTFDEILTQALVIVILITLFLFLYAIREEEIKW